MATGFVYTVTTLNRNYIQKAFCNVPTQFGERLYFGPCKRWMRPKVRPGDFVFGLSPSSVGPRRIVFIGHVEERIAFREAHERFPELRGPEGPIHVAPVNRPGAFPRCSYAHVHGAMHEDTWEDDLASRELDAFFVCAERSGCVGQWLGKNGPELNQDILDFLRTCSVHGSAGELSSRNDDATRQKPIAHGGLYTGLHLETNRPERLVSLCEAAVPTLPEDAETPMRLPSACSGRRGACGGRRSSRLPMTERTTPVSRILLLRVGMDLGFGGLGPLFPDGTFEYVPIPDDPGCVSERSLYFPDIPARSGGSVARFVPRRHSDSPAHYDPEFDTFTYGDPTRNKRAQVLRLTQGDMLVFYAGLRPPEESHGSRLFIIGYFTIVQVHAIKTLRPWPPPEYMPLWGNAHLRRDRGDEDLVVAQGDPAMSRLLARAVPLSDGQQNVLPEMTDLLGISGSVKRAGAGRWIPDERVRRVSKWLRSLH